MVAESGLETKFARFGTDLNVRDGQCIEGYASLFDAADQGGDVVVKGAYGRSLAALNASGVQIKMLWQHDPAQPIGVWDEVREDARGLWVKGRLLDTVAQGREAAALIAAGAIDGLSIGYRTKRATRTEAGQRLLTDVELWEVSLVTFPMLPTARVVGKAEAMPQDGTAAGLREMAAAFRAAGATIAGR